MPSKLGLAWELRRKGRLSTCSEANEFPHEAFLLFSDTL